MKVEICYNAKEMKPLFFILFNVDEELFEIEEKYPNFAFFTTDEEELETYPIPFYTVSQIKKAYNIK